MAYHVRVPASAFTKGSADFRKSASACSLPGFAFNGTYSASLVIAFSCFCSRSEQPRIREGGRRHRRTQIHSAVSRRRESRCCRTVTLALDGRSAKAMHRDNASKCCHQRPHRCGVRGMPCLYGENRLETSTRAIIGSRGCPWMSAPSVRKFDAATYKHLPASPQSSGRIAPPRLLAGCVGKAIPLPRATRTPR